jgi:hypothetical protein
MYAGGKYVGDLLTQLRQGGSQARSLSISIFEIIVKEFASE